MPPTTSVADRPTRVGRAGVAVAVAVLVALASHLLGGGGVPPVGLVLAVAALAWPPAVLLIGRRLSLPRQAAVITLAQLALHASFALAASGAAPVARAVSMPGMAGMPGMPGMGRSASSAPVGMQHTDGGMWLAHAAAAVLTVALWRHGEAVFWRLVHGVALTVRRLLALPVQHVDGRLLLAPPRPAAEITPHLARLAQRRTPRRGPPSLA